MAGSDLLSRRQVPHENLYQQALRTLSSSLNKMKVCGLVVVELRELIDLGMGELIINFMGPPPNAFLERKALDILGTYLTSSSVAPLNKEFVETESPLWYAPFGKVSCRTV